MAADRENRIGTHDVVLRVISEVWGKANGLIREDSKRGERGMGGTEAKDGKGVWRNEGDGKGNRRVCVETVVQNSKSDCVASKRTDRQTGAKQVNKL